MEVSRQREEGRKARQKTGRASTTTIHVVVDGRGEATIIKASWEWVKWECEWVKWGWMKREREWVKRESEWVKWESEWVKWESEWVKWECHSGVEVGEVGVGRRVRKPGEHQPQRYTLWLMLEEPTITKASWEWVKWECHGGVGVGEVGVGEVGVGEVGVGEVG